MTDYSKSIYHTLYHRNNVVYEIEIFEDETNKYYGRWTCCSNKQTGSSNSTKSNIKSVITDNKINIDSYHSHTFGTKSSG